jgi:hypothetical protein
MGGTRDPFEIRRKISVPIVHHVTSVHDRPEDAMGEWATDRSDTVGSC